MLINTCTLSKSTFIANLRLLKHLYVQQKVIDIKVHCLKSKANFFVNILSKCAVQVEKKTQDDCMFNLASGRCYEKTFLSNGFGFRRWDQQMPQEFTRRRCL